MTISLRCFVTILVLLALQMAPSELWAQEIDRSLGLREIKPGYDVYLHGDPALGVSSTFRYRIIFHGFDPSSILPREEVGLLVTRNPNSGKPVQEELRKADELSYRELCSSPCGYYLPAPAISFLVLTAR